MIVIYDTLGAYGGSHTLMLRMSEWLHNKNIKMTIIGTSISNNEIVEKLEKQNVHVVQATLSDTEHGAKIIKSLLEIESIKVFCFAWNHFLDVERIKKSFNLKFDNFVYCIHPETFKKGIGFRTRLMKNYSIQCYRSILEKMNQNGSLISLDEINIKESEKYLNCDLKGKTPIIYLPMFCPEREDKETIIATGFESNTLLTAARADFPYKGYMIGLVDQFARLKEKYPEMMLEFVAAGDDIQQLKDKIGEQPEHIRSSITLRAWMEYEDLKEEMRKCKLFIGMGTTVFDAALQYKPSIVVKFNTMKCISDHFVSEKPTYMTVSTDCEESSESRIEKAFSWAFDEYHRQSINSFIYTKEVYDIDKCMGQLINAETINKGSIITRKESIRHNMNQKLNSIRFRNRHASDANRLVREKRREEK